MNDYDITENLLEDQPVKRNKTGRTIIFIILGILLVALIVGVIYFFFFRNKTNTPENIFFSGAYEYKGHVFIGNVEELNTISEYDGDQLVQTYDLVENSNEDLGYLYLMVIDDVIYVSTSGSDTSNAKIFSYDLKNGETRTLAQTYYSDEYYYNLIFFNNSIYTLYRDHNEYMNLIRVSLLGEVTNVGNFSEDEFLYNFTTDGTDFFVTSNYETAAFETEGRIYKVNPYTGETEILYSEEDLYPYLSDYYNGSLIIDDIIDKENISRYDIETNTLTTITTDSEIVNDVLGIDKNEIFYSNIDYLYMYAYVYTEGAYELDNISLKTFNVDTNESTDLFSLDLKKVIGETSITEPMDYHLYKTGDNYYFYLEATRSYSELITWYRYDPATENLENLGRIETSLVSSSI